MMYLRYIPALPVPWFSAATPGECFTLLGVEIALLAMVIAYMIAMKSIYNMTFAFSRVRKFNAYHLCLTTAAAAWASFQVTLTQILFPSPTSGDLHTMGLYLLWFSSACFFTLVLWTWRGTREKAVLGLINSTKGEYSYV